MEELLTFIEQYGLWIGGIAIIGLIGLGILKYVGVFAKYEEKTRHILYVGISVAFSVIASIIYLLIVNQFELSFVVALATSIFALNQSFYAIFETTSINDLLKMILEFIIKIIDKTANTKISEKIAKRKSKEE